MHCLQTTALVLYIRYIIVHLCIIVIRSECLQTSHNFMLVPRNRLLTCLRITALQNQRVTHGIKKECDSTAPCVCAVAVETILAFEGAIFKGLLRRHSQFAPSFDPPSCQPDSPTRVRTEACTVGPQFHKSSIRRGNLYKKWQY